MIKNQSTVPPETDCDLQFSEVARGLWGRSWAICRATPRNKDRYSRCVSPKEYAAAEQGWADRVHAARAAYGRPHIVGLPITPRLLQAIMLEEIALRQKAA